MTRNVPVPATASTEKPAKPKPISQKIRAAIDAMVSGDAKDITAAAKVAGISREHFSRSLGKAHISKLLHEKIARNLNINAAKAGATKVDLLTSPNDMVRDRASSYLLQLAGHSPDTGAGNRPGGGPRAGWLIDLREPTQAGLVIVVNHPAPPPAADQAGLIIDMTPNPS